MKVLSLIVPAYNSRAFLDDCVQSLMAEEVLPQLDIIIVNDGSTDDTAEIAMRYCRRYPASFRLISQRNKGHGGALNTGCAAAVGKYLKVIDADDQVMTEYLPEFVRLLKDCSADVVLTHYRTRDISTGEVKNWRSYPKEFGRGYTFDEIIAGWKDFDRCLTFHGITYRTQFYRQFGIRLSEHVYYEDHEFATFPSSRAAFVVPLDLFVYDYRIGDVTQSVSDENQLRRLSHTKIVLQRLMREFEIQESQLTCAAREYISRKVQGLLLSYLTTALLSDPDKRQGSENAVQIMKLIRTHMPDAEKNVRKQYRVLLLLSRLRVKKQHLERILHGRFYALLRRNRDFC